MNNIIKIATSDMNYLIDMAYYHKNFLIDTDQKRF
jgi:hypothetical protein